MILLSIDTCDARGGVSVLRDSAVLHSMAHQLDEDYSSWLLPATEQVLRTAGLNLPQVDAFVAASGPGSFTGIRVGLTTVKAWAEVYRKPIAAVSRLEALASLSESKGPLVAAFIDARRGQLFGGLFQCTNGRAQVLGSEAVIDPERFLDFAAAEASGRAVGWVSLDPHVVEGLPGWANRAAKGESIQHITSLLSPEIGKIGHRALAEGRGVDVLSLDANYVRRSDAEIFAKGSSSGS